MQPRVTFNSGTPSYPSTSLPYTGIATSPTNISTVPYNNNLRTSGIFSNPGVVVGAPTYQPTNTYVTGPAVRTSGVIATPPPQLATTTFARPAPMTSTVVSTPPVALQRSTVAVAPTTVVAAPPVQQVVQTIAQPVQQVRQVVAQPPPQPIVHQVAASPPPQPIYVDEPVYVPAPKKKKFWCSPLFWALLGLLGLIGLTLGLLFAFGVLGGKGGNSDPNTTYKVPPAATATQSPNTIEPTPEQSKTVSTTPTTTAPTTTNPIPATTTTTTTTKPAEIPPVEVNPISVQRYHKAAAEQSHKLRVARADQ